MVAVLVREMVGARGSFAFSLLKLTVVMSDDTVGFRGIAE